MNQIKTLSYDQAVRVPSWADNVFARVFTVRGYAAKNGNDPAAAEEMAHERGHELAGTIYSSGALLGDRQLAARLLAEAREIAAGAVSLENGEHVMIDGRRYAVKVNPGNSGRFPQNCDPIAFVPVIA